MPLKLRTRAFRVAEATIGAAILRPHWKRYDRALPDGLWWSLEFACSEKQFLGESCEPEFTFDRFRLPVERWHALEGLKATLDGGDCCIIGHDTVGRTELRVGARTGSRFRVTCRGLCDVNWDDDYGRDVPFTIEADVRFTGVRVVGTSGDGDDSLRDFLAAHFRLDGLSEQPCREAGTPAGSRRKMVEKMFVPAGRRSNPKSA